MFFQEWAQEVHVVIYPEGVDGVLAGPQVTPLARLAKEEVVSLGYAFSQRVQVDMQVELSADALAYFGRRGIWMEQGKTGIKENGAHRLWLFKQHYWLVP
ncbi:MAG: hypothetical protein NVS3B14_06430 [Ktedonobacteraceae bacterium]